MKTPRHSSFKLKEKKVVKTLFTNENAYNSECDGEKGEKRRSLFL